jgi:hypothetical protein
MRQKIFFQFSLFTLMVVIVLSSCGKIGLTGPAGPQGAQGDTGTANVIYSQWDSTLTGTNDLWSAPAITQGVLDSAVILVYVRQEGVVYQLPL